MIDIGSFRAKTCDGITRRSFLQIGASIPFATLLGTPRTLAQTAERVRAKSVVFVFLWGGPSHLDTFDPKPEAPIEYRGPLGTIATQTPGLRFSELIPRLAQRSNLYTLIRSHTQVAPGHPDGATVALTGYEEKPLPVKPNFGSIVTTHRGQHGNLPPFVSLTSGMLADSSRIVEGYGSGSLRGANDPVYVNCSDRGHVDLPGLRLLEGLSPGRVNDRTTLLKRLDSDRRRIEQSSLTDWDKKHESAHRLLVNHDTLKAFDLTRESEATRERYGQSTFGQSSLLARRLVEARVPYIQLNYSRHPEAITPGYEFGWDTHILNFELLQDQHCPIFDRAFSAFLDDMYDRGLMEDTLVVAMGEFGRTPKINKRASRDHWPRCYFSLWAGAGIEPGRVIGTSDRLGEDPITDPVSPLMVGTTIAELAGVNAQARAEMNVLQGGNVIHELL